MTLREQIIASPETISDLAVAASDRYREAEILIEGQRFSGAVYLLGLASEMWLKIASFRCRGAGPGVRVHSQLGPARQWMSANAPPVIQAESYHSLRFWAEYLIRWRAHSGLPLSRELAGGLRHHVIRRLFFDWKIDLRYQSIRLGEEYAARVYNDAAWVRGNWERLWR